MTQMWEEIFEQPVVLKKCLEFNTQIIKEIVTALKEQDINSVVIAARGTSDHAGIYGKYIIECATGIPVAMAAPSVQTMYHKHLKLKNTLVIGISQSGAAADVLEVIREANLQGAVTVSITNFTDSPLALESKFHLFTNAGLEKSVAATKTFIAQIYLLAQLVAAWSDDENLKKELSLVPENLSRTLKTAELITEKVQRYRYMEDCFVLARGINYAIALESALKIQETSYVRAKAYAISDFHHGPFAMIENGTPVLVYAPEGPSLPDTLEMIHKLKNIGAELVIISNKQEILDLGDCAFRIPETSNDMISPFYNVTIAQMFACQLSLSRGLNPDSPRGLNKVTITK